MNPGEVHDYVRWIRELKAGASSTPPFVNGALGDTLLATPQDGGYRFDIRLQGPGETVFFDV